MSNRQIALAVAVASVIALGLAVMKFSADRSEVTARHERSSSATDIQDQEKGRLDTGSSHSAEAEPQTDEAADTDASTPCRNLPPEQRSQYEREAAAWYDSLGYSDARTYWPYQTVDNDALASMVEQGDAEAMLQLGLNRLWQATRIAGDKWPYHDEEALNNTPKRAEVDRKAFMEAEAYFDQAIQNGLFLAGAELFEAYGDYTETLELFIHPNSTIPRDEELRALVVGRQMYMNMLAGTIVFDTDVQLSAPARALAERSASNSYRFWELDRTKAGLPAHTPPPPEAVKAIEAEQNCLRIDE